MGNRPQPLVAFAVSFYRFRYHVAHSTPYLLRTADRVRNRHGVQSIEQIRPRTADRGLGGLLLSCVSREIMPPVKMFLIGVTFCWLTLTSSAHTADTAALKTIPASDPLFLSSVLPETWDISHAKTEGYIDCMMSLSDVDLTVLMTKAGTVTLNFDPRVYAPTQPATAGPIWKVQVDGGTPSDRVVVGPAMTKISTATLPPGSHRIRFIQSANTSSPRWFAHDPQLSRLTVSLFRKGRSSKNRGGPQSGSFSSPISSEKAPST